MKTRKGGKPPAKGGWFRGNDFLFQAPPREPQAAKPERYDLSANPEEEAQDIELDLKIQLRDKSKRKDPSGWLP